MIRVRNTASWGQIHCDGPQCPNGDLSQTDPTNWMEVTFKDQRRYFCSPNCAVRFLEACEEANEAAGEGSAESLVAPIQTPTPVEQSAEDSRGREPPPRAVLK